MDAQSQSLSCSPSLDSVAELFLAELREGRQPSLADYLSRYPQLADEINELFPTLISLEDFAPSRDTSLPARLSAAESIPRQLGEYLLIREIGRGGMGIVFEARHARMRRRVALKVLPPSASTKQSEWEQRFLCEARSAGQLHHSNIVPIFEVGVHEGIHFYAMQYISGQNLDVVLDELRRMEIEKPAKQNRSADQVSAGYRSLPTDLSPSVSGRLGSTHPHAGGSSVRPAEVHLPNAASGDSRNKEVKHGGTPLEQPPVAQNDKSVSQSWSQSTAINGSYFRRVANGCRQAAEALHYAHQHGILHRDIKPANLLLDTEGTIWVSDFGLAKESDGDLTGTGDLVGTLRYMAPERFEGQADPRSDVYSLGLTLYEMCTLRYAFDQSDRAALLAQIKRSQPVPPRHYRPDIPRDLETIIVKSIAGEPAARYQSAGHMAMDLGRFLADRPVLARRISLWERTWRWSRRHPARAALVACLFLICVLITAGALSFAHMNQQYAEQLRLDNERVSLARDQAVEEHERADEALEAAERANLSSKAHLYNALLGQAAAQRTSQTQGQNTRTLESIQQAVDTLKQLGLSEERAEDRRVALRTEAIAAMSLRDLEEVHLWKADVGFVQFATDFLNRRIAKSNSEGEIALHDFEGETMGVPLPGRGEQAWSLGFSPDGRFLAADYHHSTQIDRPLVILWEVDKARKVLELEGMPRSPVRCFSSDSSTLAIVAPENQVWFFNTETGERIQSLSFERRVKLLQFANQDQDLIVVPMEAEPDSDNDSQDQGVIEFWNWQMATVEDRITLPKPITAFAWHDNRRRLVAACIRTHYFWPNGELHEPPVSLGNARSNIVKLALHPTEDVLLSYAWDGKTRMFDLETRSEGLSVNGKEILREGFDPTGNYISFASLAKDRYGIWRFRSGQLCRTLYCQREAGGRSQAPFHPQHSEIVASVAEDGVELWDHSRQLLVGRLECGPVRHLRFSPDGDSIYSSGDSGLLEHAIRLTCDQAGIWQLVVGKSRKWLDGPTNNFDMHFGRKQAVVRGAGRSHAILLDMETGQASSFGPHIGLNNPSFSRTGDWILTDTWHGFGVKLWDAIGKAEIEHLVPHWSSAATAAHPTEPRHAGVSQNEFAVWNLETREIVTRARSAPDGWPGTIAYSPDGRYLAAAYSRYQLQLLDAQSLRTIAILEPPIECAVGGISFSLDGSFLSVADGTSLQVWDLVQVRQRLALLDLSWP